VTNESLAIDLDDELLSRAEARAAEFGVTPAEYVKRLVRQGLDSRARPAGPVEDEKPFDISEMLDLVADAPGTDIARDKDKLIGEAVWEHHLEETGQRKRRG
jgi:antitoxin component of RelBE/YafQ-DinJ toxin-antitoxin module